MARRAVPPSRWPSAAPWPVMRSRGIDSGRLIAAALTLALPKAGLLQSKARPYPSRHDLAGISVSSGALARLGLSMAPPFAEGSLVRIITHWSFDVR